MAGGPAVTDVGGQDGITACLRFNPEQRSLLEDKIEADLAAVAIEIEQLQPLAAAPEAKQQPKRQPLPANLPRREIRHEPSSTTCKCGCRMKRIGEDVAEKLDYLPGVFTVERHIRGKWACAQCETIQQAPVDAHVIDKGIPTTGLLAQVLVGKYADHLPLYRQEAIFARAGLAIPKSTLAQWVGNGAVQIDNNHIENLVRPWAMGRKAWLFAGSELATSHQPGGAISIDPACR